MDSLSIERGFESPYFSHSDGKVVLEDCAVLIRGDIQQEYELTDLIHEYRIPAATANKTLDEVKKKTSVLLFVRSITGPALARLVAERISGRLCVCVVSLPFGPELTSIKEHEIGEFCFSNKINATIDKDRTVLEIVNAITLRTDISPQVP